MSTISEMDVQEFARKILDKYGSDHGRFLARCAGIEPMLDAALEITKNERLSMTGHADSGAALRRVTGELCEISASVDLAGGAK